MGHGTEEGIRKPSRELVATPRPRGGFPLRRPFRGRGAGRGRAEVLANGRPGGEPGERARHRWEGKRERGMDPPGVGGGRGAAKVYQARVGESVCSGKIQRLNPNNFSLE